MQSLCGLRGFCNNGFDSRRLLLSFFAGALFYKDLRLFLCGYKLKTAGTVSVLLLLHLRIHVIFTGAHSFNGLCKKIIQLPSQAFGSGTDDIAGAPGSEFFL